MQRKRKFLLWIPVLVLLCAAFTVFCAAADETAESTDSATFIFMVDLENGEGASKITEQTYKLGETPTFSFKTTTSKIGSETSSTNTCKIDSDNFFAKFREAVMTKKVNGETSSISELPTTITEEDYGEYVITLTGADTMKVFVEFSAATSGKFYYDSEEALSNALKINEWSLTTDALKKQTVTIIYHADTEDGKTLVGLDFTSYLFVVRIDFNGKKLDAGKNVAFLYKFNGHNGAYNNPVSRNYFYSSQPNAEITATNACFLSTQKNYTYNIGTVSITSDNITADGNNLSISCRAFLTTTGTTASSAVCNVNGITYRQGKPTSTTNTMSALCYVTGGTTTSNPKLTIKDSVLYLENGYFSASSSTAITKGYQSTLTIENSNVYLRNGVTYKNDDNYEKATIAFDTVEGNNTVIYSADKLDSLVENKLFARCDRTTTGGITYLYQWVDSDKSAKAIWADGENPLFEEDWVIGSTPVLEYNPFGNSGSYYWYAKDTSEDGITKDTNYPATLKSSKSKITGNLTLYANITFNLYFLADDYITGVTYTHPNGETKEVTFEKKDLVTLSDGKDYYLFKIDNISPKDLSKAFTLDVHLSHDVVKVEDDKTTTTTTVTATYTVSTSLSKYASSVLAKEATDDKTVAGKNLVLALLDYVYEMSKETTLGNVDENTPGMAAIKKGLGHYNYTRKTWGGTVEVPKTTELDSAALLLASDPGFIFYLNPETYAGINEIVVKVNGVEHKYDIQHQDNSHYFLVQDIHISNYTEGVTMTLGDETITYNLYTYIQAMYKNDSNKAVPDYLNALYSYVLAAQKYLATPDTQVTE